MGLKMGWSEGVERNSSGSRQRLDTNSCEKDNETSDFINDGQFPSQLSDCQLSKNSVPRRYVGPEQPK
jgi:hypothetical protein